VVGGVTGTASVTVTPGAVARVAVSPSTATIAGGGTVSFGAQALDANDNAVPGATFTWAALPAAGTVTQGGVFTAGAATGTYPNAVSATAGAVTGTASVTISAGALSQLSVAPAVASVQAGGTVAFTVSGRDAAGNPVAVTAAWSVVGGGGTIGAGTGIFSAGTVAGTFANTVKAEAQGLSAFASVNVLAGPPISVQVTPGYPQVQPGGQVQFAAQPLDAFGNQASAAVTWAANAAAGSVNEAGLFTAGTTPGDFVNGVSATAGVAIGSASVRVLGAATDGGVDAGTGGADGGTGGGGGTGCGCGAVDRALPFALLGLRALRRRRER
jgi:hypothetical protein